MSNARSPREVCSTTIGTSGLMFLASFSWAAGFLPNVAIALRGRSGITTGRLWRSLRCSTNVQAAWTSASRRPQASRPLPRVLLAGRPQLLAGLRLLDADRRGLAHQQLECLTGRDVLA